MKGGLLVNRVNGKWSLFKGKFCLIFICILIVFSSTKFNYVNGSGEFEVVLGNVSADKGKTVIVPLTLRNVPSKGIYTCSFWVKFNPNQLKVESVSCGELVKNPSDFEPYFNNQEGFISMALMTSGDNSGVIRSDGILANIKFKLNDTVGAGTKSILSQDSGKSGVFSPEMSEITPSYKGGSVTVNGGAIETPKVNVSSMPKTPSPNNTPTPKIIHTPSPTPRNSGGFKDIKGHWAQKFVNSLFEEGIISGYPDDTIKPNDPITRTEAVVILAKAAKLTPSSGSLNFKDSDKVAGWAKGYLKSAIDKGIVSGYNDNTFRPSNLVTRKEMAVMLMKAFVYKPLDNVDLSFADKNKIPAWAKGYVAKAKALEVIKGYSDNTFKPDNSITRAEVFTMISNCLDLKN